MFITRKTFTTGWHHVKITNAEVIMVQNQYETIKIELRDSHFTRQSFLIPTNNGNLVSQLIVAIFDEFVPNCEVDEKDLIGSLLSVHFKEKNNLLVITEIQKFVKNHEA